MIPTSIEAVTLRLVSVTEMNRILQAPGCTTMLVKLTVGPLCVLVKVAALAPVSSTISTMREAMFRSNVAVAEEGHP